MNIRYLVSLMFVFFIFCGATCGKNNVRGGSQEASINQDQKRKVNPKGHAPATALPQQNARPPALSKDY